MEEEIVEPEGEDYNAQFREHEKTPFQPPTAKQYTFKVSEKRWKEIFGHE